VFDGEINLVVAFIVPAAADSSKMDYSHAFSCDALQAAL
jgi:hypothetical protein